MPACGCEFYLGVFTEPTRYTREDKIRIHERPCSVLFITITTSEVEISSICMGIFVPILVLSLLSFLIF